MLNPRSSLGIAQAVFYGPPAILAAVLLFHRHGRPRMAWYFLFVFSLVRLVGGIVVTQLEKSPGNVGLLIATIILLGVGVIPLMLSTIGLLRIVFSTDFEHDHRLGRSIVFCRLLFLVGVALLSSGGSLQGNYKSPSSVATGEKLVKGGYGVLALILLLLITLQAYLWSVKSRLTAANIKILRGTTVAIPFLIVRITYAFLSIFNTQPDSKWNDLSGSIAAFVIMALVMEYVVVLVYIHVGFTIPRIHSNRSPAKFTDPSTHGEAAGRV